MPSSNIGVLLKTIKTYLDNYPNKTDQNVDVYVDLETKITLHEFNELYKLHGESKLVVDLQTLEPVFNFIKTRWLRVKDTSADYKSNPDTLGSKLSMWCAKAIGHKKFSKTPTKEQTLSICMCEDSNMDLPDSPAKTLIADSENTTADELKLEGAVPVVAQAASNKELTDDDKIINTARLRDRVTAYLPVLFKTADELVVFMTTKLSQPEWSPFMTSCSTNSFAALKDLFLTSAFIEKSAGIYNAVTNLAKLPDTYGADNLRNQAQLFCLLEIYKIQRKLDPDYTGKGGWLTGVSGHRRVSQLSCFQQYIVSDQADFNKSMEAFPKDARPGYIDSGHTGELAKVVGGIKTVVKEDVKAEPTRLAV